MYQLYNGLVLRCLGPGFTVLALGPGFRPIFIHSFNCTMDIHSSSIKDLIHRYEKKQGKLESRAMRYGHTKQTAFAKALVTASEPMWRQYSLHHGLPVKTKPPKEPREPHT